MIKWMGFLLAMLFASTGIAQGEGIGLRVAYFGENAIHPGLKVGAEYLLHEKIKVQPRRNSKKAQKHGAITKRKQIVLGGNLAFYNHANNHTAFLVGAEIGKQRIKEAKGKAKLRGVSLGFGYLQRIYNVDTYEATEDGIYEQIKGGQAQFFTSFAAFVGRDLSINGGAPIAWYIKPTLFLLTPYSHSITFNAALELGITYKL